MTSTTKANASRKEVRDSIRSFARQMSEAPEAPAPKINPVVFEVPADVSRVWAIIDAA